MLKSSFVLDRRHVLKGLLAAGAASAVSGLAFANTQADAVLFTISDLHAPYARLPALLERLKALRDAAGVPSAVLLNGDIFERGNVVCTRSGGVAEWAFLSALAAEMPVVVNLGNHEIAIYDDMSTFVARADQAGVSVISNLIDRRTGRFFAPVSDRLGLGGVDISLLGLAATNPFVYRTPARDTLTFLDTAQFVADALPDAGADADVKVIMSHAGVSADKTFIDSLPKGAVIQGAHDHLDFAMNHNGVPYFHGASWGTKIGVLELFSGADGVTTRYRSEAVEPGAGDAALADVVAAQMGEHLTDEDNEIIAVIPRNFDIHNSILQATEAMRKATEADIAMIGHTTFGAPLSQGPLSRFDFNAFVRFGGGVQVAEVGGGQLLSILGRANQFAAKDLEGRTGDYVHVADHDIDPSGNYRLAVNAWTAMNQKAYLGTEDLPFQDVEGLELKAVISDHLARTFG